MKRVFTVHRGGLDREASVTEQTTVRSRAAEHRRFNQAMSDTMKELFPGHEQPKNVLHLMIPVRSWGDEAPETPSESPQEGCTPAFDSLVATLSPEVRKRLSEAF